MRTSLFSMVDDFQLQTAIIYSYMCPQKYVCFIIQPYGKCYTKTMRQNCIYLINLFVSIVYFFGLFRKSKWMWESRKNLTRIFWDSISGGHGYTGVNIVKYHNVMDG